MKRSWKLMPALAVATGFLLAPGLDSAMAAGDTYYADHISTCVDPCGGLSERGCSCVKLPPIIIVAS